MVSFMAKITHGSIRLLVTRRPLCGTLRAVSSYREVSGWLLLAVLVLPHRAGLVIAVCSQLLWRSKRCRAIDCMPPCCGDNDLGRVGSPWVRLLGAPAA